VSELPSFTKTTSGRIVRFTAKRPIEKETDRHHLIIHGNHQGYLDYRAGLDTPLLMGLMSPGIAAGIAPCDSFLIAMSRASVHDYLFITFISASRPSIFLRISPAVEIINFIP